jgi:outer membrane immunogenic protein
MKRFIYVFMGSLVVMLFVFGTVRLAATADSTATVSIQTTSVAAGVGVQWGEGVLTFKGKKHSFSLQGLDLVGVGYAQVTARGTVSNLTKLSDFEGVYVATEAAASAGSGPATITMKNPNGVTISISAVQEGVQLKLAAGGVNVDLKDI